MSKLDDRKFLKYFKEELRPKLKSYDCIPQEGSVKIRNGVIELRYSDGYEACIIRPNSLNLDELNCLYIREYNHTDQGMFHTVQLNTYEQKINLSGLIRN